MNTTYTYAYLDVSQECYREIRDKLETAGYQHAFHDFDGVEVIDMRGLALRRVPEHVVKCRLLVGGR